jgi:hypothetical protein
MLAVSRLRYKHVAEAGFGDNVGRNEKEKLAGRLGCMRGDAAGRLHLVQFLAP